MFRSAMFKKVIHGRKKKEKQSESPQGGGERKYSAKEEKNFTSRGWAFPWTGVKLPE